MDNPVVKTLSNVGRAITHNHDAKLLGVKMGDPAFKVRDLIKREGITQFSSNYALYGDVSRRVCDTLGSMVPTMKTTPSMKAFSTWESWASAIRSAA